MPTITFNDQTIETLEGANLRTVLLRARMPLYNEVSKAINCRGRGVCGTCAIEIDGHVSEPTPEELRRLSLPPHDLDSGLRLACQVNVLGDVKVTKRAGLFGTRG